jgi:hypothetical protein
MQAYKVICDNGETYYTRVMYPWHLSDRPEVVKVEPVPESPYVRAACIFFGGVMNYTVWDVSLRERIIHRMAFQGECLWHAISQETGNPCSCANCRPDLKTFG